MTRSALFLILLFIISNSISLAANNERENKGRKASVILKDKSLLQGELIYANDSVIVIAMADFNESKVLSGKSMPFTFVFENNIDFIKLEKTHYKSMWLKGMLIGTGLGLAYDAVSFSYNDTKEFKPSGMLIGGIVGCVAGMTINAANSYNELLLVPDSNTKISSIAKYAAYNMKTSSKMIKLIIKSIQDLSTKP